MNRKAPLLFLMLTLGACAHFRTPPPPPAITHRPAGVVTSVNAAEKYVIFESTHIFPAGHPLQAMRDGRQVATLRVHTLRQRPFQAADLLEGSVRVGDLVE